ncbi:uncharacterized protein N7479_009692 [Penicillium vulpinum]|uniref:Carrier domain-containing protein n=1 Tax=Penicillium vulpinum TaxID=29845 RepID=A0A1V6RG38_9EURO|nr:uncharacterized protein N7479_009692 [Penicillium vulpinum]KAJ5951279.1 hypothetical protein N7479_009692 [Penicillium vulpinum]OQE00419.1 hypothetical protein PENVUL_c052G01106 [Penicillium vulpinum]
MPEPIAIIGTACRFPGGCDSPSKLWELLKNPRDISKKVPLDRFNVDHYYHPEATHHGTTNATKSYFLEENVAQFDAPFFNIQPMESDAVDPQQRLLLETVYDSICTAGLPMENLRGSSTAIYVGMMCDDWASMVASDVETLPTYTATGLARSIVSNRISYVFDWHGPSMTIDTACSSSLVAVHQAVQSLRSGESSLAVAAGTNLILSPNMYVTETNLRMLSPSGRCAMWDRAADGYARGEGVAAVVLKTLSQALADGDHIECIIRETGVNQDGRTTGLTMPSNIAQTSLIRDTYSRAGLDINEPRDRPQFFHAHGTGTQAGDPQEAEAISTALFPDGLQNDTKLLVGSIKTVIGHTEGSAGLASLIGSSLAMKHGIIPPNLHFSQLSDKVAPFYSHLHIPTEPVPWPELASGQVKRASVNSFGFGGTNAHAIIESFEQASEKTSELHSVINVTPLLFSAASEKSLRNMLATYSSYLSANPAVNLHDLASTLSTRRSTLPYRAYVPVHENEGLPGQLNSMANDSPNESELSIRRPQVNNPAILGVFTGQGAQWPRMGACLIETSTFAQQRIASLDSILQSLPTEDRPAWTIKEQLLAGNETSRVAEAAVSQPLCLAIQVVLVDILRAAGVHFKAVVGHSSGEIGAAYAAGLLSAEDAVRIAYYRGLHAKHASSPNGEKGAMMAVGASQQEALEICADPRFKGRIQVAAVNSSSSITLSGDEATVDEVLEVLKTEQKFVRKLKVDTAYHSAHMLPCAERYLQSMKSCGILPSDGTGPVWFSSVTEGQRMSKANLTESYWVDNMCNTVLFSGAVGQAASEAGPFDMTIEIGPHPALKGPATSTLEEFGCEAPYTGLLSRAKHDVHELSANLGFTWMHLGSGSIKFDAVDKLLSGFEANRQVLTTLPSYPFDHQREYWAGSRVSNHHKFRRTPPNPLLGTQCSEAGTTQDFQWRNILRPSEISWLSGHRLQGQMVFPATGYVSMAIEATKQLTTQKDITCIRVADLEIARAIAFGDDGASIEVLFNATVVETTEKTMTAKFACYSISNTDGNAVLNAKGKIIADFGRSSLATLGTYESDPFNLVTVEDTEFYRCLTKIGYDYSEPFRGVSHIQRKPGYATGLIEDQSDLLWEDNVTFHPGMLDTALQTVFAAWAFPDDGQIWSLHVPTRIDSLVFNPHFSPLALGKQGSFKYETFIRSNIQGSVTADIHLYTPDGKNSCVQIEGACLVPFSPASPKDDLPLFSSFKMKLAVPDGQLAAMGEMISPYEAQVYKDIDRIAFWYIRNAAEIITPEERDQILPHFRYFMRWCDRMIGMVSQGEHPKVPPECLNDGRADIIEVLSKYVGRKDIRFVEVVGEHLVEVIRSGTSMLEHMNQDGLMLALYENGLAAGPNNRWLSRIVAQIAHRYPGMHIFEIGAGTGASTKTILPEVGSAFGTYTFTDVSSGFFPEAEERFKDYSNRMIFKTFNTEFPPSEQGFTEGQYDVVIAANVLHISADMEQTMANVRRLLKPGGYLLTLEVTNCELLFSGMTMGTLPGWWAAAETGRPWGPSLTLPQWDSVLQKTGFSGIDTVTPDISVSLPVTVFVSQAVDDRVALLRNPLSLPTEDNLGTLVIIGGTTLSVFGLVEEVMTNVSRLFSAVMMFEIVEDLMISSSEVPHGVCILCLTDLDEPFMRTLTPQKFTSLQQMFDVAGTLLLVSRGSRADEPYSMMLVGIGRTIKTEYPNINLQLIDIEAVDGSTANTLSEALLRHHLLRQWRSNKEALLWSSEPEVVMQDQRALIPRLLPSTDKNQRYNSHRRAITKEIDPRQTAIRMIQNGLTFDVQDVSPLQLPDTPSSECVTIRIVLSSFQSLKVGSAGFLRLIYGVTSSSEPVFALSSSTQSPAVVPSKWCVPVAGLAMGPSPSSFLTSVAANILAEAVLKSVPGDGVLLVREADEPFRSYLVHRAESLGVRVVFITSQDNKDTPDSFYIHPRLSQHKLKQLLPTDVSVYADLSRGAETDSLSELIDKCLPSQCIHIKRSSLLNNDIADPHPRFGDMISQLLQQAIQTCTYPAEAITIPLSQVSDHSVLEPLTVVDWSIESVPVKVQPIDSGIIFRPDRTYFFVGMAGELGQSLCEWMIFHGAKYIVLSSRSPRVNPKFIEAMAQQGATVRTLPLDITSRRSLWSCYGEISRTMPAVGGVVNGAMILQDSVFENMTHEQFLRVIKPKVEGTKLLDELFHDTPLDFFIVTSSITAAIGFGGQSNYSAANTFMTSLMYQRKKRGVPGSAMDITGVHGVGYAAQEDNFDFEYFTTLGYNNMSEKDFCILFAEAILSGRPDSLDEAEIVSGVNYVSPDLDVPQTHTRDIKFSHYILTTEEGSNVGGGKAAAQVRVQLQGMTSEDAIYEIVKDSFVVNLKKVLQISADEDVNLSTPLVEQGLDSLVAVMVRSWFLKEIEVDIPVLKILDGSSISDLIQLAISKIPASITCAEETKSYADTPSASSSSPPPLEKSRFNRAASETPSDSTSSYSPLQTPDESLTSSVELLTPAELLDSKELGGPDGLARSERDLIIHSSRIVREPMSFGQARFWFLHHFLKDKTPFNFSTSARLTGHLRISAFERALNTLVQRHESLRTRYLWSDGDTGTPMQEIISRPLLKLETKRIYSDADAVDELERLQNHEYDLEDWGSVRAILLTLSDTVHYFLIGCHHIALDGQSMHLLFLELDGLYNGKALPQITDASQYRMFASRQKEDYESGVMQADIDFFRDIIRESPGAIDPFSFSHLSKRKVLDNYRQHRVSTRLEAGLASKVKQIARKLHSTNFHFYLTILQALVFRLLPDTNEFFVGIADSNRVDKDSINTIGCLVNLLPLKFNRAESSKLDQGVKLTRSKVYSALQHSRVPFDVLVNELGIDRSAMHTPIFQIFMDYRLSDHEKSRLAGCDADLSWNNAATGYDLQLEVLDTVAGESLVVLKVQEALYSKEAAELLLGAFVNLLEQATKKPADHVDLSSPQLWSEKDIDDALAVGKGPELDLEWPATVAHRVEEMVNAHPDVIAIKDGHGKALTYSAMSDRVNTIAATILDHVSEGDSVGVFQEPSADWICSLLAIFRVGAAYVPLDLKNGLQRLAGAVDVGRPRVILHDKSTEAQVPDLQAAEAVIVNVSDIHTSPGAKVPNRARAESTAAILFTSGSTGVPKGIVLPHSCFAANAEAVKEPENAGPIVVLQQIALSFDFSLHQIFTALANGGTLCVASSEQRSDPYEITKIMEQEEITHTLATPTEYGMWFDAGSDILSRCSSWKLALVGGEALPKSIVRRFRDLNSSSLKLCDFYGPVEATIALTKGEVDFALADTEQPIPVGSVLPNYSVCILDEALQPLPIGVPGEIVVGGPGVAAGYLGQEELTNEKFIPVPSNMQDKRSESHGWNRLYRTGDRGRLNKDGTLIYEGRINGDDQIKLRGIRIELGEIENAILKVAGSKVSQAVVAVHGEDAEKFLVAYVVLSSQSESSDKLFIDINAALPLPNYMRPSLFIAIDSVPMNVHGKTDRKALYNIPLPDILSSAPSEPGQMNGQEKKLCQLWEEILVASGATISAETDFFHVGGNSLLLVKLQRRLKEAFGFSPRLADLMNSSTLGDMARLLEDTGASVVNWEAEMSVPASWADLAQSATTLAQNNNMTVVLTGATGYIGRHLLPSLLESPQVSRVICLVRDKTKLLTKSEKVTAISCNFANANLGLTSDELSYLSDSADIMVHCAANRSFWDDYQALRAVNFQSVRDITRLCIPRRIPLHFFSSGAVADHADKMAAGDVYDGYLTSKLAAERFLHTVSKQFDLPVYLHRPSAASADTPYTVDSVVQQDFVECAQRVGARPDLEGASGHMDLSPTPGFIARTSEAILTKSQDINSDAPIFAEVLYTPNHRFDIKGSTAALSDNPVWASLPAMDMLQWMGKAKQNGFPYVLTAQHILMGSKTGQVVTRR